MDENEPVDEREFIYRRIAPLYYDAGLTISVQREAFRPTANDSTGLSVLRALFARPEDTLGNLDPQKAKEYYVARLAVRELRNLGLTVVPDPMPTGPPGHAVIPEMTHASYRGRKQHWQSICVELAKLASTDIVHRPKPEGNNKPH